MASVASPKTRARLRTFASLLAGCTVLVGLAAGGTATGSPPNASAQGTRPDPRYDLHSATSDSADHPGSSVDRRAAQAPRAADVAPRLETATASRPVAPGVTLRSFDRYGPDAYTGTPNWLQSDSLTVDLTKGTSVGYLFPGRVASGAPISEQARQAGAVAAVNGDFFDINNSNAPLGVGIKDGTLLQSPDTSPTWQKSAAIITPDGLGSIGSVFFTGTIALPGEKTASLAGVNKPTLPTDGIEAFTPLWGSYCRCRATTGAAKVAEVEVVGGRVTAVRDSAGSGEVPSDGFVLVGRDAGADTLAALTVGDPVSIDYRARTADDKEIRTALNGRQLLVVNGVAQKASAGNNVPPAPRTAVGFSRDGTKMFLLAADGRQPAFSDGLGLDELADMMVELGAWNAVNLDGGGSTTMVARKPGEQTVRVENHPSDGSERHDPNGLGLFAPEGSGRLRGLWVEPTLDPERAAGSSAVAPARPDRVFPGLTRRLTATGYDETYGPAASTPRWRTSGGSDAGTVDREGVFHARTTGAATVTAYDRDVTGSTALQVLRPLTRLGPTVDQVALPGEGDHTKLGVLGYDREGYAAPIEPADLTLDYDHDLLDISTDDAGQYVVTARQASGSVLVTATVNVTGRQISTVFPVTVGLEEKVVADFEDSSAWNFFGERATGSVGSAEGKVGRGLRLDYDFTASTATRTGGAVPTGTVEIPGRPRALRLWVDSSGKGEWASLQVYDGAGQLLPAMRAGYLTKPGWQQLEFPVPAGTQYPLRLRRYYSAETRPDAQYQGSIVIDQLTALVPPSVDVPAQPIRKDPLIAANTDVGGQPWRFAVMSDAQFVARDPDSDLVRSARRTLREIRAACPDFLVIDGDLVDEGSPADLAFAKQVLDEELGGTVPYYYVPGNHEVMGGDIANFQAEFGATSRVFDHEGTRFLTFDTSRLSIRGSDWTQLRTLRSRLDAAAADPDVGSVVLVQHVPPRDPTPSRASELGDRKEAATIERWLSDFQRTTGKGAVFVGGHVGTFHADRVDGVPYFVNGNSAKTPSTRPEDGGFTGWSLWGVDPVTPDAAAAARRDPVHDAPDWVRTQVRPHVDTLTVTAPESLTVGQSTAVKTTLTQHGRTMPVAYPMSARWSGSANVWIGDPADRRPGHIAVLDPRTGTLTAYRPGRITLRLTVNDTTAEATVTVEPRPGG
ncbi:phosphodiester glycosidase family protein [Actinopolymorpha singaporensis]|uniref:Calcineurin-like phosphoesterase n=1 Tax=Actinopolymorpha singaporensis TaxID=117157 RepID=A0A1H1LLJ0_9ACTN|nr:phosphodiester glycosidase family protein [Actinopolymorpha singaporensis]SDR75267.1 Calcineurin-like phosphoesterase [Actinopolymorpha singaporensis]